MNEVIIIGGGLAGCEAALQIAKRGIKVKLYEMKPEKFSEAHKSQNLAEIVCSNSFGSKKITTGKGFLKSELKVLESFLINAAYAFEVEAGNALAFDAQKFSQYITNLIYSNPLIEVIHKEIKEIDKDRITIIATGPLTSYDFANFLKKWLGENNLFFYDAIAPIITFSSVDMSKAFFGSRYSDSPDYINCYLTKEEYEVFYAELVNAQIKTPKEFERGYFFERCLPVEEIAKRGEDSLRFGPLKPVGLRNVDGEKYYAILQLRKENLEGTLFSLVGFQTSLKYREQKRIFSLIPCLKNAEFVRYGSIHKNIYFNSPKIILKTLQLKTSKNTFLAGQISGVEGYAESIATGLIAGCNAVRLYKRKELFEIDDSTMIGALLSYISSYPFDNFQPINSNFGIIKCYKGEKNKLKEKEEIVKNSLGKLKELKNIIDEE